jgi:hypothetical protein
MPALKLILDAVSSTISEGRMKDVMLLLLFFFSIYGIMGMQLFGGSLRRYCAYSSPFDAANETQWSFTDQHCAKGSGFAGVQCTDISRMDYLCDYASGSPVCEQLHSGGLDGYCRVLRTGEITRCAASVEAQCIEERRDSFEQGFDFVCFDNFWLAMITLFQICTLEGWTPIMYSLSDSDGPVQLFFVSFLLICSFLMLNLVVGVICDAYATVAE